MSSIINFDCVTLRFLQAKRYQRFKLFERVFRQSSRKLSLNLLQVTLASINAIVQILGLLTLMREFWGKSKTRYRQRARVYGKSRAQHCIHLYMFLCFGCFPGNRARLRTVTYGPKNSRVRMCIECETLGEVGFGVSISVWKSYNKS